MSPTGLIEVCSLGVQKVIFEGFDKNKYFFLQFLTIANILKILKKISKNLIFWWGWVVRVKLVEVVVLKWLVEVVVLRGMTL